mmetsp:Transcript_117027/g.377651  ORF Transcript_117027/g.377651 Transcript_117027/m.377651 type:complete len:191 (+) Transcript_117027:1592-2164(+)
MEAAELRRRQKLCSRARRHIQLAHEKLLAVHAEGLALPPSRQLAFLEEHPELTTLPETTADGTRPVNWQWTAGHDAAEAAPPAPLRAEPLAALAEAMCRGEAPGLRVVPMAGAALLLEAAAPGHRGGLPVPDWRLWHAGCSPGRGRGRRWTLQFFFDDAPKATARTGAVAQCSAGDGEGSCPRASANRKQ